MAEGVIKQYELDRTREAVLDVISTNVSDPLTGGAARSATTKWMFSGFPNPSHLGQTWKFPIIVIEFPDISMEGASLDLSKHRITSNISVECHSRTRQEANQLADACSYALITTGKDQLNINATLKGPDIIGSANDTNFIGGNKYYTKTIEYEFMRFD